MATTTRQEKVTLTASGEFNSILNALDVTPEEIAATEATVQRVRNLYGNEQWGPLRMVAHDLLGELY
jgi:hypothetical protein